MLEHPVSHQLYERLADGTVKVTDPRAGTSGVFGPDGAWRSGDLRYAEAHLIRWVHDTDPQ